MGEWVWVAMGNRLNSELKYSGEWVQDTGDMTRRLKLEVTTDLFIFCQNFQGVIFKKIGAKIAGAKEQELVRSRGPAGPFCLNNCSKQKSIKEIRVFFFGGGDLGIHRKIGLQCMSNCEY